METKFTYIGTRILEICENASISRRQLQKVELVFKKGINFIFSAILAACRECQGMLQRGSSISRWSSFAYALIYIVKIRSSLKF